MGTVVRIKGVDTEVPSLEVDGRTVLLVGDRLKTATIEDEAFVQGEIVSNPGVFLEELKANGEKVDLFVFSQKVPYEDVRFTFHTEWFDFAAIPVSSFDHWMKKQVRTDVRQGFRRAKRDGVVVKAVELNDEFVRGIKEIYDESEIRQGKRFWHFGKSFDELFEMHATYQERAEFIGAYFDGELIGFLKMVYVDDYAKTMHVISKQKYQKMRPTTALIGKAVEICAEKGIRFLIYGEYSFPGKGENSLTAFKARHGFEQLKYPRYFVPLSLRGRIALLFGLHRGVMHMIPNSMLKLFLRLRSKYLRSKMRRFIRPADFDENT